VSEIKMITKDHSFPSQCYDLSHETTPRKLRCMQIWPCFTGAGYNHSKIGAPLDK